MPEKNSVRTKRDAEEDEPRVRRIERPTSYSGPAKASAKTSSNWNAFNFKLTAPEPKVIRLFGLTIWLLALLFGVSFTSFFFSWKADQSILGSGLTTLNSSASPVPENLLGILGVYLSHVFVYNGFGIASFLLVFLLFVAGYRLIFSKDLLRPSAVIGNSLFFLLLAALLASYVVHFTGGPRIYGGAVGYQLSEFLIHFVGATGTGFLIFFALTGWVTYTFNLNLATGRASSFKIPAEKEQLETVRTLSLEVEQEPIRPPSISEIKLKRPVIAEEIYVEPVQEFIGERTPALELTTPVLMTPTDEVAELPVELVVQEKDTERTHAEVIEKFGVYDSTLDLSSYVYPKPDLLEDHGSSKIQVTAAELEQNKNKIVRTLENYDIGIEKIKATIGPSVTLYEIIPKAGVRISKIKNLEDDIALNLAALGIRIIAPIPGKGTIGIEVPNLNPETVAIRSVLNSERFMKSDMDLPIALGKTISNEVYIADLARMPHLLMAGATGQGKSVGINALLVSLLYKKHPSQLKFVLVDPKKVELTLYKKIERHFLAMLPGEEEAIITDTKKVINTLNSLCIEMDLRYTLLKDAGVRNLREYNQKFVNRRLSPEEGHRFLPFIVLVIDEFADLMMTAGKEIETPIARLAQLARAIGIHLVVATQRPSVNIITGTIKANFPARIAFRVTSKIDSRTILDSSGAEQLVGRGDMLLSTGNDLIRLQCAFVDTPEVERLTDFIGSQRGYATALQLPEYAGEEGEKPGEVDSATFDPLFKDAARLIVLHQQGSTSLIQRKLQLGYNRAGRIIDQLEQAGIVGKFEGSKARAVLFPDEHSLEQLLEAIE